MLEKVTKKNLEIFACKPKTYDDFDFLSVFLVDRYTQRIHLSFLSVRIFTHQTGYALFKVQVRRVQMTSWAFLFAVQYKTRNLLLFQPLCADNRAILFQGKVPRAQQ